MNETCVNILNKCFATQIGFDRAENGPSKLQVPYLPSIPTRSLPRVANGWSAPVPAAAEALRPAAGPGVDARRARARPAAACRRRRGPWNLTCFWQMFAKILSEFLDGF